MIQIALNEDKQRIFINPDLKGNGLYFCPGCETELIPKCGEINTHHFAHKISNCDWDIDNDMSDFHLRWQEYFPIDEREITFYTKDNKRKRADICTKNGLVIEIQHSPISVEEIVLRESVYENMIWVIDDCISKSKVWEFSSKRIFVECNGGMNEIGIYSNENDINPIPLNKFISYIKNCNYNILFDLIEWRKEYYIMEYEFIKCKSIVSPNVKYVNLTHDPVDLKDIKYLQEELQKCRNEIDRLKNNNNK